MENINKNRKDYWPNWAAGIGLGLVLLFAYFIAGRGVGGSGALARITAGIMNLFASEHTQSLPALSGYFKNGSLILSNWLFIMAIGTFLGGFIGATTAGRFGKSVDKGDAITVKQRFFFAVIGGIIMGWGARIARGCTSGQALSGGVTLAVGSWALMVAFFAGGFITAIFIRRLWS